MQLFIKFFLITFFRKSSWCLWLKIFSRKASKLYSLKNYSVNITFLESLEAEVKANKITSEEAKQRAYNAIKAMRYGNDKKDYIWINDFEPKIIMHPIRKELEGKNVSDFKDSNGLFIYQEIVKIAKKNG